MKGKLIGFLSHVTYITLTEFEADFSFSRHKEKVEIDALYFTLLINLLINLGVLFGGHVRLVFTLVLFIYVGCVLATLTSFAEIPLDVMAATSTEVSLNHVTKSCDSKSYNFSFELKEENRVFTIKSPQLKIKWK